MTMMMTLFQSNMYNCAGLEAAAMRQSRSNYRTSENNMCRSKALCWAKI